MATFDLHCHPTLKSSMYQIKPSPFERLDPTINFITDETMNPNRRDRINQTLKKLSKMLMGDPLSAQCSFSQIEGGSLVVVALIAFEKTYMDVKLPTGRGLIESIVEFDQRLLADLKKTISIQSYFDLFLTREIKHLTDFEGVKTDGKRYVILHSINDYPSSPDPNTIYVVVSVEGGHNFIQIQTLSSKKPIRNQFLTNFEIIK